MNSINKITLKSPCKINLSLDITGKLENGYHTLESIFQTVSVFDEICVEKADCGITIISNSENIPCNEDNTCHKAARLFFERAQIREGAVITINKSIPSQAGLGGGSSDAAAVLKALNTLHNTILDRSELYEIAEKVGADVPFFICGGTAYVKGIGEIIKPISPLRNVFFVIAKGKNGISTPQAYRRFDALENTVHTDTNKIVDYIEKNDIKSCAELCINSLEACADVSDVQRIKAIFLSHNALLALMSGSGSAVFGMFSDIKDAENAANECEKEFDFTAICEPFYEDSVEF